MARKLKYEAKIYVDCVSVSPSQMSFYSRPIDGYNRTHRFYDNMSNLDDNSHNGIVSSKASKKLELAIAWLVFNAKVKRVQDIQLQKTFTFKVNFITLTLPAKQAHTDQEIKDVCLNNFLTVARKAGLKNYVWRAEAQPNTGNIHFHIVSDIYIHYATIQRWWNQSVELLGYVSEFEAKFHHTNPNSTDVHSVKHVKKLASYLSKYCAKNRSFASVGELRLIAGEVVEVAYNSEEYHSEEAGKKKGKVIGHMLSPRLRSIEGRLWGCSKSLAGKKTIIFDGETFNVKPFFEFVNQSDFYKCQLQWCDIWFGDVGKESEVYFPYLHNRLKEHVNS